MQLQINHVTKEMLRNSVSLRLAGFNSSTSSSSPSSSLNSDGGLDTFLDPFLSFLEEALVRNTIIGFQDVLSHSLSICNSLKKHFFKINS